MKRKLATNFLAVLAGVLLAAAAGSAQTIPYRQTNLASDLNLPGFANHLNQGLQDSWGVAWLTGEPFFTSNADNGRVIVLDAAGSLPGPVGFTVANVRATAHGTPTAIVSDPNTLFGSGDFLHPFLVASKDGGIFIWGPDPRGDIPVGSTLVVDQSPQGAVYTGLAILQPACCAPVLAVANFHSGLIETYSTNFSAMGSFGDPGLPPGFAPFGMQVIGNQLFVSYAVQDAAGHDPVFAAGAGIVSIFDLEGHFVRRFATAGVLNAPWGMTQATADFGSFSNDILIGNVGDGTMNAFDPATGTLIGTIKDQDGHAITNPGLRTLLFRADGFGNPNSLYFTAGINHGQDGLFGAITSGQGLTTTVTLDAPANAVPGATVTLSATLNSPGGIPTGQVVFRDGNADLGAAPLDATGVAVLRTNTLAAGSHTLTAFYGGDEKFGDSTSAPVTLTITNRDFSLSADPTTATVTAGNSAAFNLAITPSGGFDDAVAFSCPSIAGISCSFSPATVTPSRGAATTVLTVSTSTNLSGQAVGITGSGFLLVGLYLAGGLTSSRKRMNRLRIALPRVAASSLAVIALALTLASCGGYGNNGQANRRTVSIPVTAKSASVTHTTTLRIVVD